MNRLRFALFFTTSLLMCLGGQQAARAAERHTVRIATFNASLYRAEAGQLLEELRQGENTQIRRVAEIVQRVRPEVLLLNEFDYDPSGQAARLFRENYLEQSQFGQKPVHYEYCYAPSVNTGIDSTFDLNRNSTTGEPADAWGYGAHPGQYGMLVLSQLPIDHQAIRTFQHFLWKDMPQARLPDDSTTPAEHDYYSPEVLARFPLSSKTHADVPILLADLRLHLLISHPTPPVFDGPEDRNGLRNYDEVRFWRDYITPGKANYLYDDASTTGGLPKDVAFVIMGDLNSDPLDGDATDHPVNLLLSSPLVNTTMVPASKGGSEAAAANPQANSRHRGDPRFDTGDFGRVGNMRLDYVLPSANLKITASGVYWPAFGDNPQRPEAVLARGASDHRLVWIDVQP